MTCDVCRRRKGIVLLVFDCVQSMIVCKRCYDFYKKVISADEIEEKKFLGKEKSLAVLSRKAKPSAFDIIEDVAKGR